MTIFMILAPYGVYAGLILAVSATLSVAAGAALCAAMVILDIACGRSIKLLATGSAVVFASLACYRAFIDPAMSAAAVKLAVDGGIFVISLGSMLVRLPFTVQYAIEQVSPEIGAMPGFLRANYIITGAWAAAALLMMIGNAVMIYLPNLPFWTGLAVAFAARNSALYFTRWYPAYRRLKDTAAPRADAPSAGN
jgi:hypothetical protein